MSLDTDHSVADNQRNRAFRRRAEPGAAAAKVEPPRQRRPALAALAVLLIVGGALIAGLLAIRMDSREPVLAAAVDIEAGTLITEADLREVSVSAEGVPVIPLELANRILNGGTYARVPILAGSLVDQNMLTEDVPVGDGRAEVAVPLNPALTPSGSLRSGDLVQVIRVGGGEAASDSASVLTEALVVEVSGGSSEDLAEASAGSVRLLVPLEVAASVVDAAGADLAGLALIERGQPTDVELTVEPEDTGGQGGDS